MFRHASVDLSRHRLALILIALLLMLTSAVPALGQEAGTPVAGGGENFDPVPADEGAAVPGTYFGPAPSDIQPELIGPYQLLKAGPVDVEARTVTLPLYRGQAADGTSVWYVLTDSNDQGNAEALGLNYSAKLGYAGTGQAVRNATLESDATLTFESGAVDFSPELTIVPGEGENAFPPSTATPGSVGDADYTPLVRLTNAGGAIYNAPIIAYGPEAADLAFCDGSPDYGIVHDDIVRICPDDGTVTLGLTTGFSFGRPVLYLSTDANVESVAALETATVAPALSDIQVGFDDGAFSATERIFIATNGPTGADNPQRQGLNSALADGGGPLNVLGGIPTVATDYSPLWDANIYTWTDEAIANGYRARNIQEFEILGLADLGWITGPDGAAFGSSGAIINCPIVMRLL